MSAVPPCPRMHAFPCPWGQSQAEAGHQGQSCMPASRLRATQILCFSGADSNLLRRPQPCCSPVERNNLVVLPAGDSFDASIGWLRLPEKANWDLSGPRSLLDGVA